MIFKLRSFFDGNGKWKDLACQIMSKQNCEKYNMENINNFELEFSKGRSPTEALIRDWGFENATVQELLQTVVRALRFDVLRWLVVEKLKEMNAEMYDLQEEEGWDGYFDKCKEAQENVSFNKEVHEPGYIDNCEHAPDMHQTRMIPERANVALTLYAYKDLTQLTDSWNDKCLEQGGRLVGTGGFAYVFLGNPPHDVAIAVKRLRNNDDGHRQFFKEIDVLSQFIHTNIVQLLGVSQDGPHWCIIYKYMPNGALDEWLDCDSETPPLSRTQRCHIAKGIAYGLYYLHTSRAVAFVHRDIKSANILLDENFTAKIGDCGLVHDGPTDPQKSCTYTKGIIGTRAYMPPEYDSGAISEKFDAYSFGVVIFEMLTGLPPFDDSRNLKLLSYHVNDVLHSGDVLTLLDKRVKDWNHSVVHDVFQVAHRLTKLDMHKRPSVKDVIPQIQQWPVDW